MMKQLRQEVRNTFAEFHQVLFRPPALRRCRQLTSLLSTDMRELLPEASYDLWKARMTDLSWKVTEGSGWTHLDPPWKGRDLIAYADIDLVSVAVACSCRGEMEMEMLAVLWLLERHCTAEQTLSEDDLAMIRSMYHASEGDAVIWRRACRKLHAYIALRLRSRGKLPMEMMHWINALVQEKCRG